jgi:hypothetical protein
MGQWDVIAAAGLLRVALTTGEGRSWLTAVAMQRQVVVCRHSPDGRVRHPPGAVGQRNQTPLFHGRTLVAVRHLTVAPSRRW